MVIIFISDNYIKSFPITSILQRSLFLFFRVSSLFSPWLVFSTFWNYTNTMADNTNICVVHTYICICRSFPRRNNNCRCMSDFGSTNLPNCECLSHLFFFLKRAVTCSFEQVETDPRLPIFTGGMCFLILVPLRESPYFRFKHGGKSDPCVFDSLIDFNQNLLVWGLQDSTPVFFMRPRRIRFFLRVYFRSDFGRLQCLLCSFVWW